MTIKSWIYDHFIAHRYDAALAEPTQDFRKICLDQTGIKEGDVILDLGCGTGLNQPFLSELVGPGGRIIGVDASKNMLARATTRATENNYAHQLELIHGDLRNLNQLVETEVDAVVATLIFSVVPSWKSVFHESFKLLKTGGRYGKMDNYWPKPPLRLWLASWSYAADPKRRGFEPLQQHSPGDFVLEYHPPESDIQFYVAHATKT